MLQSFKVIILVTVLVVISVLLVIGVLPAAASGNFDLLSINCNPNTGVTIRININTPGLYIYSFFDGTSQIGTSSALGGNPTGPHTISIAASFFTGNGLSLDGTTMLVREANDDLEFVTAKCSTGDESETVADPTCGELIADSRLNHTDCGAPIAVYLGSIAVYGIDPSTGTGTLDLSISTETIDAIAVPEVNTLLAEGVNSFTGQPISVWRLAGGQFQLNTTYADGKAYIISWEAGGTNLVHIAA